MLQFSIVGTFVGPRASWVQHWVGGGRVWERELAMHLRIELARAHTQYVCIHTCTYERRITNHPGSLSPFWKRRASGSLFRHPRRNPILNSSGRFVRKLPVALARTRALTCIRHFMPALSTQFSPCSVRYSPFHQHRWGHPPPSELCHRCPLTGYFRFVVGCSQHFGIVGNGQVTVAVEQGDVATIQVCTIAAIEIPDK